MFMFKIKCLKLKKKKKVDKQLLDESLGKLFIQTLDGYTEGP